MYACTPGSCLHATRTVPGTFHNRLGGASPTKKKNFSNIFFFCHEKHFWFGQLRKVGNREARHETHARTRNGPKISQVRDATINALNAFNEGFEGLPGLKNQIWKHFFFVVFHGDSEFHIFKSIWGEKISKKCVHWLSWRFLVFFQCHMAFICELTISVPSVEAFQLNIQNWMPLFTVPYFYMDAK